MQKILFVIVFLFSTSVGIAQLNAGIENKIRELEQLVVKGILNSDSTLLKQVWDPEFMVNTPHNNIAKNRDAVFQNQKAGFIDYSLFERVIENITVQQDVVITMGYEFFISRNDIPGVKAGEKTKRRFTNIWLNKNGNWVQIARHASIICPSQ